MQGRAGLQARNHRLGKDLRMSRQSRDVSRTGSDGSHCLKIERTMTGLEVFGECRECRLSVTIMYPIRYSRLLVNEKYKITYFRKKQRIAVFGRQRIASSAARRACAFSSRQSVAAAYPGAGVIRCRFDTRGCRQSAAPGTQGVSRSTRPPSVDPGTNAACCWALWGG